MSFRIVMITFFLLSNTVGFSQEERVSRKVAKGCDGKDYIFKEIIFKNPKMTIEKAADWSIGESSGGLSTLDSDMGKVVIPSCENWKAIKNDKNAFFVKVGNKNYMGVAGLSKNSSWPDLNKQASDEGSTTVVKKENDVEEKKDLIKNPSVVTPSSSVSDPLSNEEIKMNAQNAGEVAENEVRNSSKRKINKAFTKYENAFNKVQDEKGDTGKLYNALINNPDLKTKKEAREYYKENKENFPNADASMALNAFVHQRGASDVYNQVEEEGLNTKEAAKYDSYIQDENKELISKNCKPSDTRAECKKIRDKYENLRTQDGINAASAQALYDNQPAEKSLNENFFKNAIGNSLFDSYNCEKVWSDIQSSSNLSNILDPEYIGGVSTHYESTCGRRYVTEDFLTRIHSPHESLEQLKKAYVCADAAKRIGDPSSSQSCVQYMNNYNRCDQINGNTISRDKSLLCRFTEKLLDLKKGQITSDDVEEVFRSSAYEFEIKNNAALKEEISSLYQRDDRGNLVPLAENNNLSFLTIDTLKKEQVALCQFECRDIYGEQAFVPDVAEVANGGVHGCFEAAKSAELSQTVAHCYAYKSVATINFDGNEIDESDREYPSFDGKYTCERTSPVTADYKYCKKLVVAYNAAFAAEQAMGMAEGIQRNIGQANATGEMVKGQASGNGQLAGLEGVKSIAKTNESIETQKAALYTTQFAVFGAMMVEWPTINNIKKACERGGVQYPQECSNAVHYAGAEAKRIFFPNYGIKQQFYAELIKAGGNAAVAWIKRNMYRKQQNLVDEVKDMTVTNTEGGGFVLPITYCEQYPNSPQCRGRGNRVSVDGYSGGGLNLVGGGSNDYGFSNDDLGEYNEGREAPSNATIEDITSMLGDTGEKGSSDFDKVAGAKVTESAAGGGGGGAGSGGGGASLASSNGGSTGEGEKKAADYGVTRSGANYVSSGGAAGYTGSKAKQFGKDKKVDNPFSSLFGAKKNSRNVASDTEDIAPKESSLFKKISNRYMAVKNQKRLLDTEVK